MNKKGFTLIELLAVVVILAVIALITTTAVTTSIKNGKQNLCETQYSNIIAAAQTFGSDNLILLPNKSEDENTQAVYYKKNKLYVDETKKIEFTGNDYSTLYISIQDLIDFGLLDKEIMNPKNSEEIDPNTIIKIVKDKNNYKYLLFDFCNDGKLVINFENHSKTTITYGQKVERPSDPEKLGYKFIGWYKDSDLINEFDFNTLIEENMTLYPKFEERTYVSDGLILHLDGINNTRNGHSTNTTVWEDLSGNNYDGIIGSSISIYDKYLVPHTLDENCYVDINNTFSLTNFTVEITFYAPNQLTDLQRLYSFSDFDLLYQSDKYSNMKLGTSNPFSYANVGYLTTLTIGTNKQYENRSNRTSYQMPNINYSLTLFNSNLARTYHTRPANIRIYSFRIYNRELTADEIYNNYDLDHLRFSEQ